LRFKIGPGKQKHPLPIGISLEGKLKHLDNEIYISYLEEACLRFLAKAVTEEGVMKVINLKFGLALTLEKQKTTSG
jgi:hypothetical protein